jgi:hypothetical protein
MELLNNYFRIVGYGGGGFLLLVGATGVIVGVLQVVLKRTLNLWPLQLAAGFLTAILGLVLSVWHLIMVYSAAATMSQRLPRLDAIHNGYIDFFLMVKIISAFMLLQIIAGSFGKTVYMNASRSAPMQVPIKGAAVPELKTNIQRVS